MTNTDSVLHSKEEMLAEMESRSPEEQQFVATMMAAREKFDDLIEPIITSMISECGGADDEVMNTEAYAVAEGIKQGLTAHLGKLVSIIGVGTEGAREGENALKEMTAQTMNALLATVKITTEALAKLKAQRGEKVDG